MDWAGPSRHLPLFLPGASSGRGGPERDRRPHGAFQMYLGRSDKCPIRTRQTVGGRRARSYPNKTYKFMGGLARQTLRACMAVHVGAEPV